MSNSSQPAGIPDSQYLAWLADAPLFIDGEQVAALYDAVVRPEYQTETIKLSLEKTKGLELAGKAGVELEVGSAGWLKAIFPFLDASAKATGEVSATHNSEQKDGSEIELHAIDTPQRQLVQLALHYLTNIPGRLRMVPSDLKGDWIGANFISAVPRGLVFIDLPPGTKFIPMAAEAADGTIKVIYQKVVNAFKDPKKDAPKYPEPAFIKDENELFSKREEYWNFFDEYFNSTAAMEAVETIGGNGLLRWIDYRVLLGPRLPSLHLSVQGRGKFDTGTFAYRLIKRGFKHGARIVGTMKSEPDMNVLAIFER